MRMNISSQCKYPCFTSSGSELQSWNCIIWRLLYRTEPRKRACWYCFYSSQCNLM